MASTKATIGFETSQVSKMLAKFGFENLKDAINETLFISSLDAESLLKRETPVSKAYDAYYQGKGKYKVTRKRGGSLRMSWGRGAQYNFFQWNRSKMMITMMSMLPYASLIVEQTPPLVIKPKTKKRLFFAVGKRPFPAPKGDIIFAKQVTHPGGIKTTGKGGKALLPRVAEVLESKGMTVFLNVLRRKGII